MQELEKNNCNSYKKWSYNNLNESQALVTKENSSCSRKIMLRFSKYKCKKVALMNISDII
jgi:hypothetical protein